MDNKERILNFLQKEMCIDHELLNDNKRLYHDIGIYGDDYYDIMVWISNEFSVDLDGCDMRQLCPSEVEPEKLFFKKKYIPLRILDIVSLSHVKSWKTYRQHLSPPE